MRFIEGSKSEYRGQIEASKQRLEWFGAKSHSPGVGVELAVRARARPRSDRSRLGDDSTAGSRHIIYRFEQNCGGRAGNSEFPYGYKRFDACVSVGLLRDFFDLSKGILFEIAINLTASDRTRQFDSTPDRLWMRSVWESFVYLKRLFLENVGPIISGQLDFPFDEHGNPVPVVLVGQNGSGKSIALSFLINSVLSARQAVFQDSEVEKDRVYKLRSPQYIHSGAHHYYAEVLLDGGFEMREWQLDSTRKVFEENYRYTPPRQSWESIPEHSISHLWSNFYDRLPELRHDLGETCFLYFPPNRFEEPAWLNEQNLIAKAEFSDSRHMEGEANRSSIQYAPMKLNKDWLLDILFDSYVLESSATGFPIPRIVRQGRSSSLYDQVLVLLKQIFSYGDQLRFGVADRKRRAVALMNGDSQVLQNIFQLSTGESLVLDIALSILRDYDRSNAPSAASLSEIRGLVIIDEVDLHLHVDYQHSILPKLLHAFPKVQFVVTSHSPMFLMGMQKHFGNDGFSVRSMPSFAPIDVERYEEFERAYALYKSSMRYANDIEEAVARSRKALVFFEGSIDLSYIRKAAELLGETALLQQVSLFDGGGFGKLDNVWKHFEGLLFKALPHDVLLIYDCDRHNPNDSKQRLMRRVIPKIDGNPIQSGIENLFGEATIQRAIDARPAFIDITPAYIETVRGDALRHEREFRVNKDEKTNLCNWLCAENRVEDFDSFKAVFALMREALGLD